jgi:Rps23 Pro-64 3,4-dihydroxylase Tpa1-like proline 4-hydroxylase
MTYVMPKAIQPTNVYAGAIWEYEDIWPNPKTTIEAIEWEDKKVNSFKQAVTKGGMKGYRTNSNMSLSEWAENNETFRKINNDYFLKVYSASLTYAEFFELPALHHVEGYNILRYQTGEEYKAHFDGGLNDPRLVSPIIYLNDDYEGGELEFVHHKVKIKPKAGALYLFPSNYSYSHIAHPVTEGTKYAIVTWLYPEGASAPQQ